MPDCEHTPHQHTNTHRTHTDIPTYITHNTQTHTIHTHCTHMHMGTQTLPYTTTHMQHKYTPHKCTHKHTSRILHTYILHISIYIPHTCTTTCIPHPSTPLHTHRYIPHVPTYHKPQTYVHTTHTQYTDTPTYNTQTHHPQIRKHPPRCHTNTGAHHTPHRHPHTTQYLTHHRGCFSLAHAQRCVENRQRLGGRALVLKLSSSKAMGRRPQAHFLMGGMVMMLPAGWDSWWQMTET